MISCISEKVVSFSLLISLGVCQNINASNAYHEKMVRQNNRQYAKHQERQFERYNKEFKFLSQIDWNNPWTYLFSTMLVGQVVLPNLIPGAAAAPGPSALQSEGPDLQSSPIYSSQNTTSHLASLHGPYSLFQHSPSWISQGGANTASFLATASGEQSSTASSSSSAPTLAQSEPPSAKQIATTAAAAATRGVALDVPLKHS
ncbi:hypothetical protein IM40_07495 [Candidatus Paracaedimonas acanthamoebae]|nr:hypothetical protein IM40_07495 [Candidatus Paracaedimonas acanthamoebae]